MSGLEPGFPRLAPSIRLSCAIVLNVRIWMVWRT